jgi:hypothetical protein
MAAGGSRQPRQKRSRLDFGGSDDMPKHSSFHSERVVLVVLAKERAASFSSSNPP